VVAHARWNIGFTFDAAERACTAATPADNCYPRHMATVDSLVDALFWCEHTGADLEAKR
jgi:hypothetical protein